MVGTGRAADGDTVLGLGADAFLDLQADHLADAGEVDVVFDVIGGEILDRSATLVRAGARSSPSPRHPRFSLKTGGPSSSSSNPIAFGSRTLPSS